MVLQFCIAQQAPQYKRKLYMHFLNQLLTTICQRKSAQPVEASTVGTFGQRLRVHTTVQSKWKKGIIFWIHAAFLYILAHTRQFSFAYHATFSLKMCKNQQTERS